MLINVLINIPLIQIHGIMYYSTLCFTYGSSKMLSRARVNFDLLDSVLRRIGNISKRGGGHLEVFRNQKKVVFFFKKENKK